MTFVEVIANVSPISPVSSLKSSKVLCNLSTFVLWQPMPALHHWINRPVSALNHQDTSGIIRFRRQREGVDPAAAKENLPEVGRPEGGASGFGF